MPPIYNPYDWYWRKRDGSAYHSRRQREVPADDPEYQVWLAKGHTPMQNPGDNYGQEKRDLVVAVLKPWGLKIYPLTEAEEYEEDRNYEGYCESRLASVVKHCRRAYWSCPR